MATTTPLDAVLALHRLQARTQCGAISIPLVHHHADESDRRPGPLRTLTCSKDAGHEGPHKDTLCCYSFQEFADWQVVSRKPRTFDVCACGGSWPCETIQAIQRAS